MTQFLTVGPSTGLMPPVSAPASRSRLRAAAAHLELPASPATKRSRQILRAYCGQVFEADNQQLIRQLGWPATEFVPDAELRGEWALSELDDLWTPKDTPEQLTRLFDELSARLASG